MWSQFLRSGRDTFAVKEWLAAESPGTLLFRSTLLFVQWRQVRCLSVAYVVLNLTGVSSQWCLNLKLLLGRITFAPR